VNQVFNEFAGEPKTIISERLGQANPGSPWTRRPVSTTGYGPTNQDVVIPSFLAAYTGKSAAR
jgi:hypothetical protein